MNDYRFFIEQIATPIGTMLLLTDEQGHVRALDWKDCEGRMHRLLRLHYDAGCVRIEPRTGASTARRAMEAYFAGQLSAVDLIQVKTGGSAFQREVWTALRAIPVGRTTTYGRLALLVGRPTAVRAIGLAVGANSVGVVVPCHRVIGANASLTGYAGGIERKRWLLAHEGGLPAAAQPKDSRNGLTEVQGGSRNYAGTGSGSVPSLRIAR